MTSSLRKDRVEELGESTYRMLKESYDQVRELKEMVDRLHRSGLQQETRALFDQVAAIKLTTDRLCSELERYLRPECDPDSALETAMTEEPES